MEPSIRSIKIWAVMLSTFVIGGGSAGIVGVARLQETSTATAPAYNTWLSSTGTAGVTNSWVMLPPTVENPEWFCGQGTPIGWMTVTPGHMWWLACGQCVNPDGSWWFQGTHTRTPTGQVTSSYTRPMIGTATITQTRTITPTLTQSYLYQYVSGSLSGSYICPAAGCAGLDSALDFVTPPLSDIELVAVIARVGNNHSGAYGELRWNVYDQPSPMKYVIQGGGDLAGKSDTQQGCFYRSDLGVTPCAVAVTDGILSGNNYTASSTIASGANSCNSASYSCGLKIGNHSGNANGVMTFWVTNIIIVWRVRASPAQRTEMVITPMDDSNYCKEVHPDVPFVDFGWKNGFQYTGHYNCVVIGPNELIGIPPLVNICFRGVTLGSIVIFGSEVSLDAMVTVISVVIVAAFMLRRQ